MQEISHLTQEQILNIVKILPFFAPFSPIEQELFAGEHARIFCYRTGEFLIQEGTDDHTLFLLLAGAASVVKEGTSIPLALLEPGDMFGEVGFLTQRKRTTNVIVHPASLEATPAQIELAAALAEPLQSVYTTFDPPTTTVAMQFQRAILQQQERETRIQLKKNIIQCLLTRVDTMHERLTRLTGCTPLLTIDADLDAALHQEQTPSLALLEETTDRIVEQLLAFVEDLNHRWIAAPSSAHA
ncbi:MAG: cyclic nucleotide-binding domain-containing protein [Magnetococcales bacterium]|nr:cyclic nucleotide-binding domain-containing protein [Magnetococcales bacterium]